MSAAEQIGNASEFCFHCGDSLDTPDAVFASLNDEMRGFCCHGCLGAAELISELGLFAYYDRREAPSITARPLDASATEAFERFDDPGLQRSFVSKEGDGSFAATLSIAGMRCAACSWLLEERLARVPGVVVAQFGLASQRARVQWEPTEIRLSEILAHISQLGYRGEPNLPDTEEALLRSERRAALRRLGVSGLGTMQVMMFSVALYAGASGDLETAHRNLLRLASLIVTTPVLAYAGLPFLIGAWRDLRSPRVGPDVPIALALVGAYLASTFATFGQSGEVYFDSVCMFIFFITLGRTLERDLRTRAELRIRSLHGRVPQIAHRIEEHGTREVPVADIRKGDVVAIHPGEAIPADGLLIEGQGEVNESMLTGEASPVLKHPGDALLAGSTNFDTLLHMRVERTGTASTLQQIATLLDRAQLEKPPIAELANRLARGFLTAVIIAASAVGFYWWWTDPSQVIPVVISVLIATCPCALSLATPTALAAPTHGLASRGFLITRGHALEALARVNRVVFDKTGTLSVSTPVLREVRLVGNRGTSEEATELASRLETNSTHPLARAVRAAAKPCVQDAALTDSRLQVEPGLGVTGKLEGRIYRLGQPAWSAALSGKSIEVPSEASESPARSVALLADEEGPIAWFEFDLPLRPRAKAVASWLRDRGYANTLLSGDPSREAVDAVAQQLHIEDARGNASPEVKFRALDEWIAAGDTVLAIGDGINDAPLLGRAQVSIAMGSGSDLARLRADAVLLDDQLASLPLALDWARKARRITQQNFAWALGYNLCVLPLAAMGMLEPYLAAIGMSLSSLLVVSNSMRLRNAPRVSLAEEN